MSEEAVLALATVAASVVLGIGGYVFNLRNSSNDRRIRQEMQETELQERYRAEMYEKKLAVYQDGYKIIRRLLDQFKRSDAHGWDDVRQELSELGVEGNKWLLKDPLWLDRTTREQLTDIFDMASRASTLSSEYQIKLAYRLMMVDPLITGMVAKHLDPALNRQASELFDRIRRNLDLSPEAKLAEEMRKLGDRKPEDVWEECRKWVNWRREVSG